MQENAKHPAFLDIEDSYVVLCRVPFLGYKGFVLSPYGTIEMLTILAAWLIKELNPTPPHMPFCLYLTCFLLITWAF
jgi:hypothetical protein